MAGGTPDDDAAYVRRAISLARRGWGQVTPNPLVGAVVVASGRVVGEGWHRRFGEPHAEVEALRAAGVHAKGATLYVSLEPCSHHGKTPPCTEAILAAGIRRVVFAAADPHPVAAGGAARLLAAGLEVLGGVEEESARSIDRPFFRAHERDRASPWVELKLALSLDARIADAAGRSQWITGEPARLEVHRLRAGADAIAVGVGTALADDPILTARGDILPRVPPIRVVFDRSLRLRLDSRLVRSAPEVPLWVIASAAASPAARGRLEDAGARVIAADGLTEALEVLAGEGIRSLFCEGGAALASALLEDELVDRLHLFYAPLLLGRGGADPFRTLASGALSEVRRWKRMRTSAFGEDTLITMER